MKYFLVVSALLLLFGCEASIERKVEISNKQVDVGVLFTDEDGYKVKVFDDAGIRRYYVTPGPAEITWRDPGKQGKQHTVSTSEPPE